MIIAASISILLAIGLGDLPCLPWLYHDILRHRESGAVLNFLRSTKYVLYSGRDGSLYYFNATTQR